MRLWSVISSPPNRILPSGLRPRSLPPQAQKFIDTQGYFRTRPERDGLDGFFAAALVKEG